MPDGGGVGPSAQSLATQMAGLHLGRTPGHGAFDRRQRLLIVSQWGRSCHPRFPPRRNPGTQTPIGSSIS